jgi:hypothetical protein
MELMILGILEIIIGIIMFKDAYKHPVRPNGFKHLTFGGYIVGIVGILVGIITIIDAI